jgi:hypothetical protein
MFILSFFEIPKGVMKRLDFYRSRFFGQSTHHKKSYKLTKWNIICRPKDQGGLRIEVLDIKTFKSFEGQSLERWLHILFNV